MVKIILIGAGYHGHVIADILIQNIKRDNDLHIVGFLDDDSSLHGRTILGIQVLGSDRLVDSIQHDALIVSIGDNSIRKQTAQRFREQGEKFFSAVHPAAVIGSEVKIGQGCMICAGAVVNAESRIGDHVILNTGCTIDHHNEIDDYVHVAPGCHTGGEVHIGEGTLVGLGAHILPRCEIGSWSIIGGGATVIRDIPERVTAVGTPCRIVKSR